MQYQITNLTHFINQPLLNLPLHFPFNQLFPSTPNQQILIQFFNLTLPSSLSSPIHSLTIQHPHIHTQYQNHKFSILHLLPTLHHNTQIPIQIQFNHHNHFLKPTFYYSTPLYPSQIKKPTSYDTLR
ncbi:PD-(D/E)XK nuclease family transposase, partial [Bacillus thuringiensis]|uniref:PD-(D/E)XK nuclease family transposase n=1 Tax=Bacillus thuringiensis TaxID=1428 RepID=UPI003D6D49AC